MTQTMYGVVLWADRQEHKAVIWCEDQGDLALYPDTESNLHAGVSLDAGDLIQFDMRQDRNLRFARNPRLLAQKHCPELAEVLQKVDTTRVRSAPRRTTGRPEGNVVPFPAQKLLPGTLRASQAG
ncbi:hypothetical protein [Salipiger aestuarii]|uniref:Uncharacterized protein n=2 Tax=Salipiger aestuarii TaxID=568098 RepID=A0A327YQ92_9RHOB|nr:hypothetical protein [Salipiger aestuarii]RAK21855.1 hypothetical protein ATI53_100311 [Salipiger aestuarii]